MSIRRLKIVKNSKGNIIKILSRNDTFFKKFGECYISEIKSKKIKAWRYHKRNSQKIVLIDGKCKVVLINKKKIKSYILNSKINSMLIIPKNIWYGYYNLTKKKIKILNIIDDKYDKKEILKKKINEIYYKW
tara:strand:- start:567 stop:962 length:396 start_codon:yes stop_codon:yes gene_type:complete